MHVCTLRAELPQQLSGRASRLEYVRREFESHLSAAFPLEKVVSGLVCVVLLYLSFSLSECLNIWMYVHVYINQHVNVTWLQWIQAQVRQHTCRVTFLLRQICSSVTPLHSLVSSAGMKIFLIKIKNYWSSKYTSGIRTCLVVATPLGKEA